MFVLAINTNNEKICRKLNNVAAKMVQHAAIQVFDLESNIPSIEDGPLKACAACRNLQMRMWASAIQCMSWSWDNTSWPFPGVPALIVPGSGSRLLFKLCPISKLKEAGMPSIQALEHWLRATGEDEVVEALAKMGPPVMELNHGSACFLPAGHIPLITALEHNEEQDKGEFLVNFMFPEKLAESVPKDALMLMKQHMEFSMQNLSDSKTWVGMASSVKEFIKTFEQGQIQP